MIHLTPATFRTTKNEHPRVALAVTTAPGLSDVTCFIEFDNMRASVYSGDVWDYQLNTHSAILVQSGAASFDIRG